MAESRRAPNVERVRELLERDFRYRWAPGRDVSQDAEMLTQCINLFDQAYGVWGPGGPRPGARVRLQRARLQRLLAAPDAWIASAWMADEIVGYCIVSRVRMAGDRVVNWVTQLVVREDVRALRIATKLLYSVWQFSDCYAWGLATANPFAVRALETATRRGCRRALISSRGDEVCRALAAEIDYIPDDLVKIDGKKVPVVDTQFHVAHTRMKEMKEQAARSERPWALGDLAEGQEWFAITFADQPVRDVGQDRLDHLLEAGDAAWIEAYERMSLDDQHLWHRHAAEEVRLIIGMLGDALRPGMTLLDIGCGDGRHVREFISAGFDGHGIDIAPGLIGQARDLAGDQSSRFNVWDGRTALTADVQYDVVTLLYDVIGSSSRRQDDLAALQNARSVIAPGGMLALSVMNREGFDARIAPERVATGREDLVAKLEALDASNAMEATGTVFDPDFIVKFGDLYFRKEQFLTAGNALPTEMIVRDRRFTGVEIVELVAEAGFDVISATPVQAGHWGRQPALGADDSRAKEWLVLARPR